MNLIQRAQDLAHRAHDAIGQRRKYTFEPYWVHTDDVVEMARTALPPVLSQQDEEFLAGLHLHDYREDVVTELKRRGDLSTLAAFEAEFDALPPFSRQIVFELTDVYTKENFPKLNRASRHKLENIRLGAISAYGKTGKLADLISNTSSIVEHDPDFARVYIREKWELLPYLADGSPSLLQTAHDQTIACFGYLKMDVPPMPEIIKP